jgi:chitinase
VQEITYAFLKLQPDAKGFYVPVLSDPWADVEKRFTDAKEAVEPFDNWNDAPGSYYGCFGQFKKIKALKPDFVVGVSIGGWTGSKYFSKAVESPVARQAFCQSILEFCQKYSFVDIIDIDWEHISPAGQNFGDAGNIVQANDGPNFVECMKMLRELLDSKLSKRVGLTMAVTGAPAQMVALPVEKLVPILDEFRIMTYDYAASTFGPGPASHQSNLFKTAYTPHSIDVSVNAYLTRGVPAGKLLIGVPFYSRGFANTNGLGQPSSGMVKNKSWEDGVSDYKDLPLPGSTEMWDDAAKAAYCYSPTTRDLNSYDTPRSIVEKSKYIFEKGLKGVIVWEISGDVKPENPRSLIKAIYDNLLADDASLAKVTRNLAAQSWISPHPVQAVPPVPVQSLPQAVPVQSLPQAVPVQSVQVAHPVPVVQQPIMKPPGSGPVTTWSGAGVGYTKGAVVEHVGKKYTCLNAHFSQLDWAPGLAASLWQVNL